MHNVNIVWMDDKRRARALIRRGHQPVARQDISAAYTVARAQGATIDSRQPLVVYGTHCLSAGSPTFQFEQLTDAQIDSVAAMLRGQLRLSFG